MSEADEPSSQCTSSNTTTVGRSRARLGEETAGSPIHLTAHGLAVQVSHRRGTGPRAREAEERREVGEDLGGLLSEERRHAPGKLPPALSFGIVAVDARRPVG